MTTIGGDDRLSKADWTEQVVRAVARRLPDPYPEGYATAVVQSYLDDGYYEDYLDGKFPEGVLYVPRNR